MSGRIGGIRSGLKPDEKLAAAEVADQGAAFASRPAECAVTGLLAAHTQDQQRWMSLGRRVDLKSDVAIITEIRQGGSEQSPGRFHERRAPRPGEIDGDASPVRPCRADTVRESRGQEAGREKLVPQGGVGQCGAHPQHRVRRLVRGNAFEHRSCDASRVRQGRVVHAADRLGPGLKADADDG